MSRVVNKTEEFLQSKHFIASGEKSQKTILEMAITRALDEPNLSGNMDKQLRWDPTKGAMTTTTASKGPEGGFTLDHVYERQFISGLAIFKMEGADPPISILNDILLLANLPGNLVWIPKALHTKKSNIFGRAAGEFDKETCHYLDACQASFKQSLDQFDASTKAGIVKEVVKAMKETHWYTGKWEDLIGESWF